MLGLQNRSVRGVETHECRNNMMQYLLGSTLGPVFRTDAHDKKHGGRDSNAHSTEDNIGPAYANRIDDDIDDGNKGSSQGAANQIILQQHQKEMRENMVFDTYASSDRGPLRRKQVYNQGLCGVENGYDGVAH